MARVTVLVLQLPVGLFFWFDPDFGVQVLSVCQIFALGPGSALLNAQLEYAEDIR